MRVKLIHGMLRVSARTVQTVTEIEELRAGKETSDGNTLTAKDLEMEGGYWVKTNLTKGEWWAWCHFRSAEKPA